LEWKEAWSIAKCRVEDDEGSKWFHKQLMRFDAVQMSLMGNQALSELLAEKVTRFQHVVNRMRQEVRQGDVVVDAQTREIKRDAKRRRRAPPAGNPAPEMTTAAPFNPPPRTCTVEPSDVDMVEESPPHAPQLQRQNQIANLDDVLQNLLTAANQRLQFQSSRGLTLNEINSYPLVLTDQTISPEARRRRMHSKAPPPHPR